MLKRKREDLSQRGVTASFDSSHRINRLTNPFPSCLTAQMPCNVPQPIIQIIVNYIDSRFFELAKGIFEPLPIEIPLPNASHSSRSIMDGLGWIERIGGPYGLDVIDNCIILTEGEEAEEDHYYIYHTIYDISCPNIVEGKLLPNPRMLTPITKRKREYYNGSVVQLIDISISSVVLPEEIYHCDIYSTSIGEIESQLVSEYETLRDFISKYCTTQHPSILFDERTNCIVVDHFVFLLAKHNGNLILQLVDEIIFEDVQFNWIVTQVLYIEKWTTLIVVVKEVHSHVQHLQCEKLDSPQEPVHRHCVFGFQWNEESDTVVILSQDCGYSRIHLKSGKCEIGWQPRVAPAWMQFLSNHRFLIVYRSGKWEIRNDTQVYFKGEEENRHWSHVGITSDERVVFVNEKRNVLTIWS